MFRGGVSKGAVLPVSLWKKNGNQVILRCLQKDYKMRIIQVYTVYKYWGEIETPVTKDPWYETC